LVSFVAGADNMCGLDATGKASCFGYLHYQPAADERFKKLVLDGDGACGLHSDGTVNCFAPGPAATYRVPPSETFVDLAMGTNFNCGLRNDGTVVCWGFEDHGQAAVPVPSFR
jgi:alpha-tubulin suppressor-like RCC1 family protein